MRELKAAKFHVPVFACGVNLGPAWTAGQGALTKDIKMYYSENEGVFVYHRGQEDFIPCSTVTIVSFKQPKTPPNDT